MSIKMENMKEIEKGIKDGSISLLDPPQPTGKPNPVVAALLEEVNEISNCMVNSLCSCDTICEAKPWRDY